MPYGQTVPSTLKNASIVPTPLRGHIPLYLGGFTDKALERTAKYGDGYFGNEDVCELYYEKLRACGKDGKFPDEGPST